MRVVWRFGLLSFLRGVCGWFDRFGCFVFVVLGFGLFGWFLWVWSIVLGLVVTMLVGDFV